MHWCDPTHTLPPDSELPPQEAPVINVKRYIDFSRLFLPLKLHHAMATHSRSTQVNGHAKICTLVIPFEHIPTMSIETQFNYVADKCERHAAEGQLMQKDQ